MKRDLDVRPSPIAGRWYPAQPQNLASQIDRYLSQAQLPEIEGDVLALIVPHAGHRFSGPVAAHAFAAVQGLHTDLVALVAPMHHPYEAPLLTSAHDAYATPLGEILIDQQALQELEAYLESHLGIGLERVRQDPEHSLEIELPFLQRALRNDFRLLPLMVRDYSPHTIRTLADGLAQVLQTRQALLVASTDLSHFYPQPIAHSLDQEVLRRIESFDPQAILNVEAEGLGFACGRGPLAAVLWAAQALGADRAQVVHYATSGDVTGDYEQVVGYAAAVISRRNV